MESKDGKDYFHNYDFIVKWLADALVGQTLDVLGLETAPIEDVFAFEIADINVRAGRVDVMVRDRDGRFSSISRSSATSNIVTCTVLPVIIFSEPKTGDPK